MCCACGRMTGPNTPAGGTSTPQGEVASTRKNRVPVSFTVRKTSESGSLDEVFEPPGPIDMSDSEGCCRTTDGGASDSDARSWERAMRPTIVTPTISSQRQTLFEIEMDLVDKPSTPAEIYDRLFAPALFQQWGPIVADRA